MARYLDPRSDLVFKRVFGEHPDLAKSFLNALMPLPPNRQIVEIDYLPSEMVPTDAMQKRNSIVDVRCTDNYGRQFIIEMQMYWTPGFIQRLVLNASKAYTRQDYESGAYKMLKPVYALAILNENFEEETEEFYHLFEIINRNNPNEKIGEMEFVFVELLKFKPKTVAEKNMMVLWLRFLKETHGEHEMPPELTENPDIKKALDLCREVAFTRAELFAYEEFWDSVWSEKTLMEGKYELGMEKGMAEGRAKGLAEGRAKGLAEGRAEGRAEGEKTKALEIARKLQLAGIPVEQITSITGLSEEEIVKQAVIGGEPA
ncbi:MAG: Rpn family recombination-promoting nuclease/putative transposase [Bacteroidales bacterium]|jgi:predicted transposase/invertase (TIGR01784 family)|nr:Rpn family recombination-promoting nuclease/putative transposase [Bacteroidales bacterium]